MNRRRRYGATAAAALVGGIACAILAAAIGPEAAAQLTGGTERYALSITGTPGTRYEGRCTVATVSGGEEVVELAGVVPRSEEFEGEGVACRIQAHGPLTVEIAGGGGRSRSATSGGEVNIAVR